MYVGICQEGGKKNREKMADMGTQSGGGPGSTPLGENLIPLVNRLQDIFSQARCPDEGRSVMGNHSAVPKQIEHNLQVTTDLKIALPQVAVIGSQSSGKSSVLEALVRGTSHALGSPLPTCHYSLGTLTMTFRYL